MYEQEKPITVIKWDDGDITYHELDSDKLQTLIDRLDNIDGVCCLTASGIALWLLTGKSPFEVCLYERNTLYDGNNTHA
jgi:hypothetical protein